MFDKVFLVSCLILMAMEGSMLSSELRTCLRSLI